MTLYTQVVQLSPSQVINGRDDTRFSVQFRPIPGTYTVTATIYYSPSSTTIGDPSFKPDNASAKTFTFTVLGAKLSGQGIHFQDELDAGDVQSFNAHVTNLSNKELLVRVDVSIRNPDETTSQITSASFLLNPGQTRNDITVKTSVLTVPGDYCLTASLKYGIVTNNDGILDDKKILGTSKTVHGCFEVKQNTSSGQSACDDEDDD